MTSPENVFVSATTRYPELAHYADRPDKAAVLADALDGYGEQEREVRRDALNKRIAAEQSGRLSAAPGDFLGDTQAAERLRVTRVTDVTQAQGVGDRLLTAIEVFLGRFVAYPSEATRVATVLWAAHTHALDCFEHTPRLAFLSPEPGSGKTRALEILELLTPHPLHAVNATPAYLFRKVADVDNRPTILFDEADTVFGPRAKDNEDVRGMLNAGHARGAVAGRCVVRGKVVETEELPAFCAVALAGLGDLPDTVMTRSIVVRMRRRAPAEVIEPYRRRLHAFDGEALRDRLGAWIDEVKGDLEDAWPDLPDGITDRAADVWEPLLSIAEAAGGDWPERARVACVSLVTQAAERPATLGIRLLEDVRTSFNYVGADTLSSETLLTHLYALDESPWADMRGKPLDARGLARYLKKYEVVPRVIRQGDGTVRGYRREDLHDAWSRYLPLPACAPVTSETDVTPTPTCAVCTEPMTLVEPGQSTHPTCNWEAA